MVCLPFTPAMFSGKYRMEADEDGCYFIGMPLLFFFFFFFSFSNHRPTPHHTTTEQTGIRRTFATCSTFSGTRASRYASPLVWVSCRVMSCIVG
jgi:hypothetical protein